MNAADQIEAIADRAVATLVATRVEHQRLRRRDDDAPIEPATDAEDD